MKKTLITFVSLLLLSGACWSDDMETNANAAKYYDNAKVVRIKSVEGEGFVQRSYDEGNEEATVNLPLFEKDTVGTTDGRLAVYLGRLNYLRLDADSVVVLEKVPQLRKTDLVVRVEQGSIYLDIENLDRERGIEVQTPDCGVFLLDKGVYRVNAGQDGLTEVIVIEGIAEVAGSDDSRNVRENQKIVMSRGRLQERPYYFYASEKDDFDNWNEEQNREQGYARYGSSRYLQSGYEDYEHEMSRSGRWTYMSEYGSYVWSPYHAGADWRPYANGRWVWNPYYGYVWTSYDTCGWFTHHYGRWHWSYSGGWYWIPSYHWSPAWVSWFWNDHYYGWSPMSWWNRPVIIVNNRWDRHFNYHRGIPHHSRSTIIIRKNELSSANIHRVALNKATLGQGGNGTIAYRGSAPSDRPVLNKVTVINARGRSVTYKQGAVVSAEKYRTQGSDIRNMVYKYDHAVVNEEKAHVVRKGSGESGAYFRSRSGSESGSSGRARTSSASDDSPGKASVRSKSGSSSGSSSGKSSYRSRSGSSSSSSSSGSSSGTAKKKKGEPSYLTRSGGGYSPGTQETGLAAAAGSGSRYTARSSDRVSYRSYGTTYGSGSGNAATASSTRRYIGSIPAIGRSSGYARSNSNSGNDSSGGESSYKPSSASSSYSRPSGGGSYASGSSSSSSGSSYRSGSASGSSYRASSASSSSSSSSSSGSRAAKKK
jgi:hypothetical protein